MNKNRKILSVLALSSLFAAGCLSGCNGEPVAGPQGPQGQQGLPGDKGDKGTSITGVEKISTEGKVDTYKISFSDGTSSVFTITNGSDGSAGTNGHSPIITIGNNGNWFIDDEDTGKSSKGTDGSAGTDGISITSVAKTSTNGLVDTYTITYSNSTTTTFTVTNGAKGDQGIAGKDGTSMLTGSGVPAADYGNNGDSYIDTSTWNYYVRESDAWVLKGNIKGEDAKTYIPCVFYDIDGTKLYEFYFEKGKDIEYKGPAPRFDENVEYDQGEKITYKFVGWDKPLTNIQEPTVFTAKYESKTYGAIFRIVSSNGNAFETLAETEVTRGETAVYPGPTPVCREHPDWQFVGWDLDTTNIKQNTFFTAMFRPVQHSKAIEIRYQDYDGRLLGREYRSKGAAASQAFYYDLVNGDRSLYAKPTTYDPATDKATARSYRGWDKSFNTWYSSDTTLTVAYNETVIDEPVKVTYLHEDGEEIFTDYVLSGSPSVYPYETPFSYDALTVKQFTGWDKNLFEVTQDIVAKPTFKTVLRSENGEYPTKVVTDQELISKLNTLEADSLGNVTFGGEKYYRAQNAVDFLKTTRTTYKVSGNTYFLVEPVKWRFLDEDNGYSLVLAEYVLDWYVFNSAFTVSNDRIIPDPCIFGESEIRGYMNGEMFDRMFGNNKSKVLLKTNDNTYNGTGNPNDGSFYIDFIPETEDYLFPLTYRDYVNRDYGFVNDKSRLAYGTDFYRGAERKIKGVYPFCEAYYTRTPALDGHAGPYVVNPDVYDVGASVVDSGNPMKESGVRPACWIKFTSSDNLKSTVHLDPNGGKVKTGTPYVMLDYNIDGTDGERVSLNFDNSFNINSKIPAKDGYKFVCWCVDEALEEPLSSTNNAFSNGDTLYAKWAPLDSGVNLLDENKSYTCRGEKTIDITLPDYYEKLNINFSMSAMSDKNNSASISLKVTLITDEGETVLLEKDGAYKATGKMEINSTVSDIENTEGVIIRIEATSVTSGFIHVYPRSVTVSNAPIEASMNSATIEVPFLQKPQDVEVEKEGYRFVGWKNEATGEFVDLDINWIDTEENVSLKAIWEEI